MATTVRKLKRGKCKENVVMSALPVPMRSVQDTNLNVSHRPYSIPVDSMPIPDRFKLKTTSMGELDKSLCQKSTTSIRLVIFRNNILSHHKLVIPLEVAVLQMFNNRDLILPD
ncbi:hypothetical protein EVAR_23286_1 [Eumeta japonica]|uniref:Uncharacterized protein n=1 Tax=Eumeta variegata TaxID=151549 RepID=A0A4C1V5Q4_EUMVA|nr:hypothetical protein EVAR_23286_1 [Eumeta japonica]